MVVGSGRFMGLSGAQSRAGARQSQSAERWTRFLLSAPQNDRGMACFQSFSPRRTEGWRALMSRQSGSPKFGRFNSTRRGDFELPGSALFAGPRKGRYKPSRRPSVVTAVLTRASPRRLANRREAPLPAPPMDRLRTAPLMSEDARRISQDSGAGIEFSSTLVVLSEVRGYTDSHSELDGYPSDGVSCPGSRDGHSGAPTRNGRGCRPDRSGEARRHGKLKRESRAPLRSGSARFRTRSPATPRPASRRTRRFSTTCRASDVHRRLGAGCDPAE